LVISVGKGRGRVSGDHIFASIRIVAKAKDCFALLGGIRAPGIDSAQQLDDRIGKTGI
jgi:hypothetical protein